MRSEMLVIDTVVSLTLAKWETLSGQFGGNLTRSTGFNHIDVDTARKLGIAVVGVTSYSPHSVAEFAVGLLLPSIARSRGPTTARATATSS